MFTLVASATIVIMDTAIDVTKQMTKRYAHRIVNTVTYLSSTASLRRVLADVNADEVSAIFHAGCKIIVSAPIMVRISCTYSSANLCDFVTKKRDI